MIQVSSESLFFVDLVSFLRYHAYALRENTSVLRIMKLYVARRSEVGWGIQNAVTRRNDTAEMLPKSKNIGPELCSVSVSLIKAEACKVKIAADRGECEKPSFFPVSNGTFFFAPQ